VRGGARPGAGRPKGSKYKTSIRRHAAAVVRRKTARALRAVGLEPFAGDAYAFLVWTYRNPAIPIELRLVAAKAAAPFEKPRLASMRHEFKSWTYPGFVER
jgi:hypothetical protein